MRIPYGNTIHLKMWKDYSKEIFSGNYIAKIDSKCVFLDEHTEVSGPYDPQEVEGNTYKLIKTVSGKRLWVEEAVLNIDP